MSIQTKTMTVKSDTSLAETTTTIRDTVTFDVSNMPNGITYKGLKAVLSFADPIQWNKASTYDALTVVWDDASHGSYASKRHVPANIELTNEFYWLRTADLDAQVEMYRQEVQEMDRRVTDNTNSIKAETARAEGAEQTLQANIEAENVRAVAAEKKISGNAVLIGNSYTMGPNEAFNGHTLKDLAGKIFDSAYCNGGSAAAFLQYPNHDYTFRTLLIQTITSMSADVKSSITHVIFNSAIGDSYCIVKYGIANWRSKMHTELYEVKKLINQEFPNCKYIGICLMESMDKNVRVIDDVTETFSDLVDLHSEFIGMCATSQINYLGFVGWNLLGTKWMDYDKIHPTIHGYDVMNGLWIQALHGNLEYLPIDQTTALDMSKLFDGAEVNLRTITFPFSTNYSFSGNFKNSTFKNTGLQSVLENNTSLFAIFPAIGKSLTYNDFFIDKYFTIGSSAGNTGVNMSMVCQDITKNDILNTPGYTYTNKLYDSLYD